MITDAIKTLVEGRDLSGEETHIAMMQVMSGDASPTQIAAFVVALRMKGETPDEIAGCARAMRAHVTPARPSRADLVDTCGTGGDGLNTFNISTSAALVAAAAGATVAKHGNRAMSSRTGSADVLEALGVRIDLRPEDIAECIDTVGFGFLFAQAHHPAMRHVGPVRRELGIRTVFNLLGPLTNPAGARRQVLGVYAESLVEPMRAGAREARGRARHGGARRRRPGRAHADRREPGVGGARRRGAHLHARPAPALDRAGAGQPRRPALRRRPGPERGRDPDRLRRRARARAATP